jgi:hypothetical protein
VADLKFRSGALPPIKAGEIIPKERKEVLELVLGGSIYYDF